MGRRRYKNKIQFITKGSLFWTFIKYAFLFFFALGFINLFLEGIIGPFVEGEWSDVSIISYGVILLLILYVVILVIRKKMYYNTIFDGSRKDAFNVNKVYLIKDTKTGYIKIGFTSVDVNQRLKSLQTGNPSKLKLLKVYDGNMQDEQNLHKLFTNKKVGGEWFNLNFFDSMKISKYFKNLYKFDD